MKMKVTTVARLNFALILPKALNVAAGQVIEEILIQTNANPKSFDGDCWTFDQVN